MINSIESATRDQFQSQRWKEERRFRLTSSKFDLIVKRKMNFEKFAIDLINPKEFTSRYVAHGIKNEPIALEAYEKLMFTRNTPVKVLKCGFVVCQDHFGVAEVKCPETKYHLTPLDACQDPNFFCEAVNGQCKLKRTHSYFAQVQGHMGVTGASWCDFIVYTKKGISVERILFDAACWTDLKQKFHCFILLILLKLHQVNLPKINLFACKYSLCRFLGLFHKFCHLNLSKITVLVLACKNESSYTGMSI